MARETDLAAQHKSDSTTIKSIYNDWSGSYDVDLDSWGYQAPVVAAGLLAARVPPEAQILDAGCGTGKVGQALAAKGYHDLFGIDLSSSSLDLAATTGCYRALSEEDLTALPTSIVDETFSALICVGVLTYLPEVEAICREFCRVVEPAGTIVLTQRSDLFVSRDTQAVFERLAAEDLWEIVDVTEGRPYLPGHDEYQGIDVHYGVFERI